MAILSREEQEPGDAPGATGGPEENAPFTGNPIPDEPGWEHPRGRFIQRSMGLLATSTPEHRHRVRVVIYGQSIMGGVWWTQVRDYLRERFPHADLDMENLAMGGYAAVRLNQTAEHDIYPKPPDLLIFHVFGGFSGSGDYERIIAETRHRTTAEIAVITDHLHRDTFLPDRAPTEANRDVISYERIPDICRRYGCELIEIRRPWRAYLQQQGLQPGDLLNDGIHLNEHGGWLMAQLVNRHLVHLPGQEPTDTGTVTEVRVGTDVHWWHGRLALPFSGNRIDAVFRYARGTPEGDSPAAVRVDGARPSAFPDAWRKTRATGYRDIAYWPVVCRVDHDVPVIDEEWTLTFLEVDRSKDWPRIRFRVEGSRTGFDGEGSNMEVFVSRSRRAVLHPRSWAFLDNFRAESSLEPGFSVRWRVERNHVDVLHAPERGTIAPGCEHAVPLVSGIGNAPHQLELSLLNGASDSPPPGLVAFRIYRPPIVGDAEAKIDKRPVESTG